MKPTTQKLPRVLLCAPQHESKMYCFDKWYERIISLTYSNYDIFIADNSPNKENTDYLNSFEGVTAVFTKDRGLGLMEHINDSHQQCADYALDNKYDYIFHLETDVFPPLDVIERLLVSNRMIVSGSYDIFFGKRRKGMIQMSEGYDRTVKSGGAPYIEHNEPAFFNGTIQQIYHAGIGCILIHTDILKAIKFRVVEGTNYHSDTWFANDCYSYHFDVFNDSTIQCEHYNQTWLAVIE
jgi:hypothetical protein